MRDEFIAGSRRSASLCRRGLILVAIHSIALAVLLAPGMSSAETPRVYPNAESVQPLAVGQAVPSVEVRTIDGEVVDLATRIGDRGALLVFYRGGW